MEDLLKALEEHFQGNDTALEHVKALRELAATNGTSDDPPPQPPGGPGA